MAGAVEGAGVSWSERATEGAFLARPSLLIFSEMDIVDIFSVDGVASRELVDGSFLIEVAVEAFFTVGFGVEVLEGGATEPERT